MREILFQRLSRSFGRLFDLDGELFLHDPDGVHEQTLTFRLGLYLQQEFPQYHVDCEYNRAGRDPKRRTSSNDLFRPDVIVHRRQRSGAGANLIAVEAKKERLWQQAEADLLSNMAEMTHLMKGYGYRLGLCWRIARSADPRRHKVWWFAGGEQIATTTLADLEDRIPDLLKRSCHAC